MSDKSNVSMGVSMSALVTILSPIVLNEKIQLKLISGAIPENCQYRRRSDDLTVFCDDNFTITFTEPGIYRLFFSGTIGGIYYGQHESYDITVK